MDLLSRFQSHLKENASTLRNATFLLAVSGGVDSVVLCDLFNRSNIDFVIAHCNFRLREYESERDEAFVRNLAKRYGKQVLVQWFDTADYATAHKISTQVAARDLRYNWFRTLLPQNGWIVTAHHADDNIETTVMNFFRGTGLRGLIGMDVFYESIYRPMLNFRKHEILTYALAHNLDYVEDSSNATSHYTRNYFRNELLPAVSKVFPEAEENILRNIKRLQQTEELFVAAIQYHKKKLIVFKGKEEHIPILKLQKTPAFRTVVWEIIREKGFTAPQVDECLKLMHADNGSYIQSASHRLIRNRKWLIITAVATSEQNNFLVIEQNDKKVVFADKLLAITRLKNAVNFTIPAAREVACFDAIEIKFPLLLRRWKQGDYFYPLGMKKKKKLSRFLIDQKLSATEKEKVWVLEMDKKIIWIVGYRIDDRFKVQPSTKEVIKFTTSLI